MNHHDPSQLPHFPLVLESGILESRWAITLIKLNTHG